MKHSKDLAALLLVGALISGLVTSAVGSGTAADPLVTLEWLQNTFIPKAVGDANDHVDDRFDDLTQIIQNAGTEGQELRVKRGDILRLESGSSLTLLAGTASALAEGEIVDVTSGDILTPGSGTVETGHRYLAAENTTAAFSITSDTAVVRLTGLYQSNPSQETDYNALADALKAMGMFAGSDTPYGSSYDLEKAPTRTEGLIMFLRMLGEEEAARTFDDRSVTFLDVPNWALPYVSYAYDKGYTAGQLVTAAGEVKFGSYDELTPRDYVTFLLRALGYVDVIDFKWKKAVSNAQEMGVLTQGEADLLTDKPFLRSQVVYLSYFVLSADMAGEEGTTLLQHLANNGSVDLDAVTEIMQACKVQRV